MFIFRILPLEWFLIFFFLGGGGGGNKKLNINKHSHSFSYFSTKIVLIFPNVANKILNTFFCSVEAYIIYNFWGNDIISEMGEGGGVKRLKKIYTPWNDKTKSHKIFVKKVLPENMYSRTDRFHTRSSRLVP